MRILLGLIFILNGSFVFGSSLDERANSFLRLYSQDINQARQSLPYKRVYHRGREIPLDNHYHSKAFRTSDIVTGKYIDVKAYERNKLVQQARRATEPETFSGWLPNDDPLRFVDMNPNQVEQNILRMEEEALTKATLDLIPWSDDYWAIDSGVLGARYGDENFWMKMDWVNRFKYIASKTTPKLYTEGDLKKLSPSEKYDLLVGDQIEYSVEVDGQNYPIFGSLTYRMWSEGAHYYKQNGEVESWMGICHGWAAASYMMNHPQRSVQVKDMMEGKEIHFYPTDIKSLASLLWANAKVPHKFIGGRCNSKDPSRDDSGRLSDPECLDTNPGAWHIVVVNQIAKAKRSFIMDANFDYQVWNQPVYTYQYQYFRPSDKEQFSSLKDVSGQSPIIELANWNEDPYRAHRDSRAKYVVGISMELGYVVENQPAALDLDILSEEYVTRVDYYYDIELDEDFNIVGGEWYQNLHPDFLWSPPKDYRALALGDYYMQGIWQDGIINPIIKNNPQAKNLVIQSSLQGQPLGQIVEGLILSSQGLPGQFVQ